MRSHLRLVEDDNPEANYFEVPDEVAHEYELLPKEIRRQMYTAHVEDHGPKGSAWILGTHRKQLRKQGFISLEYYPKAVRLAAKDRNKEKRKRTLWFFLAIDFLSRRTGWEVERIAEGIKRIVRIRKKRERVNA